ncbi:beta-ketoacyl synthase chain length factor [Winogradskyella ursingii]|uniref:beta-ketoacyl synthase chain length factor n=1 Tax=Winogradskyella ursingii TaxID=2686079 RepID=UPI0015C77AF8|nr:beta-ketoacyl synthase chain length factor [Winogradskyella ursingii]
MKGCYIHSAVSISAQDSFDAKSFDFKILENTVEKATAIHPNYRDFIPPAASRRMATGVKMGVTAAKRALQLANLEQPDAIITGSGMGCIEDTEKFLNSIIANNEEFLTPTPFIQSTHNTVGAQIALGLKCKAYNNTFVHGSLSFESALIDAKQLFQENEAQNILVGGVEELGKEFVDYVLMMETSSNQGIKVPFGEGASFFVLSSEPKLGAVNIHDIETISLASENDIIERMKVFLSNNNLTSEKVDAIIFGNNGDSFDSYYNNLASTLFEENTQLQYKNISGEFYTVSAFGLFMATKILEEQKIPSAMLIKNSFKKPLKNILLYNQFKGRNHSFMLISK